VKVVQRPLRDPPWSAFVAQHPAALPFHHPSWAEVLAACYRFPAFGLTVEDADGTIVAGLPVLEVRRRAGRRRWVSLPFTDRCPPLTDPEAVDAVLPGLLDQARRQYGVARLEVRAELAGAQAHPAGEFLTHQLALLGTEDEIFRTFHPSQVRRNIQRARRAGVTVRRAHAEEDLTSVFYRLHTRTRRRLGVPVQPLRYFRLLWRHMLAPGHGALMIAELDGSPVAAAVFLASHNTCVYKYGASDEQRWHARPNHLLFWEAIRWAAANGCRTFDFGRTDLGEEGLRSFKSRWGAEESRLRYSVLTDAPPRPARGGLPPAVRSVIRHGPGILPRAVGELLYRYTA
jgi:CelD/BcsL family acetyltransferase involved in cellulose biosynthesis